jgi:crossover junction endodeoxyribonuclease RuvC
LKILGIDPGFGICGYAIIEEKKDGLKIIKCGTIETSSKNSIQERIKKIYQKIYDVMKKYRPDTVVLEEIFFNKNVKTAILIGEVRGVIKLASAQLKIPIFEYNPLLVKQTITGYGKADKKQIRFMVKKIFNLKNMDYSDDLYDALAISFCHFKNYKFTSLLENDCLYKR